MIASKTLWVENFCKKEKKDFPYQKHHPYVKTYSFSDIEEWLFNGVDCIIALLTIRIHFKRVNAKYEFTGNRKKTKTRAFTQIRLTTEL